MVYFYLRYAIRSLWRERQRTIFTLICIIIGVTAVVTLQMQSILVQEKVDNKLHEVAGGDFRVFPRGDNFSDDTITRLAKLKSEGTISAYTVTRASQGTSTIDGRTNIGLVYYVDPAVWPLYGSVHTIEPPDTDVRGLLQGESVVISERMATDLNLKVGDTINLRGLVTAKPIIVRGIAPNEGLIVANPALAFGYVLAPMALVGATSKNRNLSTNIYVNHASDVPEGTAQTAIERLPEVRLVRPFSTLQTQVGDATTWLNTLLISIGFFALIIGGIGVINSMLVLIGRRIKEIATLKTLGLTRERTLLLFAIEAATLGGLGSILGTICGMIASYFITRMVANIGGVSIPWHIVPSSILAGLFIGMSTTIVFGIIPALTASRTDPAVVLRTEATLTRFGSLASVLLIMLITALLGLLLYTMTGQLLVSLAIAFITLLIATIATGIFTGITWLIARLPMPWIDLRLALRALDRKKSRTAIIMLTVTIGILGSEATLILAQDFRQSVDEGFGATVKYNLMIAAPRNSTEDLLRTVRKAPGFDYLHLSVYRDAEWGSLNGEPISPATNITNTSLPIVIPQLQGGGMIGVQPKQSNRLVTVSGLDFSVAHPNIVVESGRLITGADTLQPYVMVNSNVARQLNLKTGDHLALIFNYTGRAQEVLARTIDFEVVGLFSNQPDPNSFLVTDDTGALLTDYHFLQPVEQAPGGDRPSLIEVRVNHSQAAAASSYITSNSTNVFVLNIDKFSGDATALLDNMSLFPLFLSFLVLLSGTAMIANNVALTVLERKRELAVMKAVGAGSGRVMRMILLENSVIGLTGGLMGMGLAVLSAFLCITILKFAVRRAGVLRNTTIYWDGRVIIGLIVLAPVLAIIAAIFSAYSAAREKPIEVLRAE